MTKQNAGRLPTHAEVGNTTYTLEEQIGGVYVKLSRFNPARGSKPAEHGEFYVPRALLVDYVAGKLTHGIVETLKKLGNER